MQGQLLNSAAGVSIDTVSCSRTSQQGPTQDKEPAGSSGLRLVCVLLTATSDIQYAAVDTSSLFFTAAGWKAFWLVELS